MPPIYNYYNLLLTNLYYLITVIDNTSVWLPAVILQMYLPTVSFDESNDIVCSPDFTWVRRANKAVIACQVVAPEYLYCIAPGSEHFDVAGFASADTS